MQSEAGLGLGLIIPLSSVNSPYLLNSSSSGLVLPKLGGLDSGGFFSALLFHPQLSVILHSEPQSGSLSSHLQLPRG